MITSDDSNLGLMNRAFSDSTIQLWNQNPVKGKYVIAYELDPGLHQRLKTKARYNLDGSLAFDSVMRNLPNYIQSKLPKVCHRMFPIL